MTRLVTVLLQDTQTGDLALGSKVRLIYAMAAGVTVVNSLRKLVDHHSLKYVTLLHLVSIFQGRKSIAGFVTW